MEFNFSGEKPLFQQDAQERVRSARKEEFLNKEVLEVVAEAKKLGITAEQLKQLIERGYDA